jgi:hypothetical protein
MRLPKILAYIGMGLVGLFLAWQQVPRDASWNDLPMLAHDLHDHWQEVVLGALLIFTPFLFLPLLLFIIMCNSPRPVSVLGFLGVIVAFIGAMPVAGMFFDIPEMVCHRLGLLTLAIMGLLSFATPIEAAWRRLSREYFVGGLCCLAITLAAWVYVNIDIH